MTLPPAPVPAYFQVMQSFLWVHSRNCGEHVVSEALVSAYVHAIAERFIEVAPKTSEFGISCRKQVRDRREILAEPQLR